MMGFDVFRRDYGAEIFDYQLVASYFEGLKKPRDKISSLVLEGKIIRLKKGLYVFGENWRKFPLNLEVVANVLYGPSCISFEYALGYYGFLSERPRVITSLTIGDSKSYRTSIGTFEYKAISQEKFKIGIDYIQIGNEGFFIASREKALVDLVYRTAGIRTLTKLKYFLFEEMRIDEKMFHSLRKNKLSELIKIYNRNSVTMLGNI